MAHLYQIGLKPTTTKYQDDQAFFVVASSAWEAEEIGKKEIEKGWSDYYEFSFRHYIADLSQLKNGDIINIVG